MFTVFTRLNAAALINFFSSPNSAFIGGAAFI